MNILELLQLQQTIFQLRLELQKLRRWAATRDAQVNHYRTTNYRLRKELVLAREKMEQLEEQQIHITAQEFETLYHEFYNKNLEQIENEQPVAQAKIKVSLLGYKLERSKNANEQIDELIGLAMEYAYELAKQTCKQWTMEQLNRI